MTEVPGQPRQEHNRSSRTGDANHRPLRSSTSQIMARPHFHEAGAVRLHERFVPGAYYSEGSCGPEEGDLLEETPVQWLLLKLRYGSRSEFVGRTWSAARINAAQDFLSFTGQKALMFVPALLSVSPKRSYNRTGSNWK